MSSFLVNINAIYRNTLTHLFFVLKMPPDRKGKRKVVERTTKRKSLSFTEKRELCEWKRDNSSYNQEDLAKKFNISKPQVCKILKEKDKWLSIYISNKEFKDQKRDRGAKYPQLDYK